MNQKNLNAGRQEAIEGFEFQGKFVECVPCGNGHINDTYMVTFEDENGMSRYSLQHMNRSVFKDPVSLMNNILHVTAYLKEQISAQGGDPQRETLDFVCTKTGEPYFVDSYGEYWRAYHFVEDAYALEEISNPQDFYESAVAFGHFQRMLADFPADSLTETIAGFHDTKARFAAFEQAVEADVCHRAEEVQQEIQFVRDRYDVACVLGDLLKAGKLPLRVTHNDTKSNNVLIDKATGRGLCVIDLDTVMPGLVGHDFGDAIRFASNFVEEDCKDASRAGVNLNVYWAFAEGFLKETAATLTENEVDTLGLSCFALACELATRFLDDYLVGDKYFKTKYPDHNLVRTRCQIALAQDMQTKMDAMNAIVRDCARRYR